MSTESYWLPPGLRCASAWRRTAYAALASVWIIGTLPGSTAMAQDAEDLMEVFWEFRYSGGVNTVVGSRYDGQRFYVSLGDVFGALQVNVVQEPSRNMAHGFYVSTTRPYEIDFNAGRALVGNTQIRFDSTEFVREDLGFFLALDLYERLFGMVIMLDERNLTMSLSTPNEMPVVAEQRRRATRVIREEQTFLQRNAPLLYDRNRALATGGVVGYRLATQLTGSAPRASLNLRGGGELFGGDLELGMNGNYAAGIPGEQNFSFNLDAWQWRYVLRSLPALRQAQVGQLNSDGLRSFSFVGTRFSNDPVEVQRFFGSYPMRIESEPGWEVELYLNNQLIDVRQTDAAGIVNLEIPVTYGSTSVTVREYGPSGEFRESERRIQVPFSFVPPGEIRYNLYAGQALNSERKLIQATTSIGLTSWLTAKWGFDYVTPDSTRPGEVLANLSWGSVSARIGPSYILTMRAAPGALFEAAVNAFYPSLASFSLNFTKFESNRIYNQTGRRHETRANVNVPFRLGALPFNLRTTLSERLDSRDIYFLSAQQNLSFNPGVFRLDFGVRREGRYIDNLFVPTMFRFEPRFGYSFARTSSIPKPVRGLLVSLRSSYDVDSGSMTSLSANLSRRLGRTIRLQTDIGHQFQRSETTLSLRVSMDLNSMRTTTGSRIRTAATPTFTQDVSGALSYDVGTRRLNASDRDWVGRSAATIRMFVDYNGNDRRDNDEPLIENGGVSFRRAVSTQQDESGHIIVYNLQAYEQYNLTVDQSRIRNPFWIPKTEEFSFITDPNVHKVIDIPFLVTGEVTGSILRQSESGLTAVPGLKLHIEQTDGDRTYEEPVFSDGSFYKLGMFPGTYRARVDSTQLRVLGAVSDPPVHEFTVAATDMGDAVDGIDFILRSGDAAAETEPDAEDEAAQPEEDVVEPADDVAEPVDEMEEPVQEPEQPADEDVPQDETQPVREDQPGEQTPDETVQEATVYIIQPGLEGLKELAEMVYGDETLWPKIWLANSDLIEEPSDVESGMQLVIPTQAPLTPVERAAGEGYEARQAAPGQEQTVPTDPNQEPGEAPDAPPDAEEDGGERSHVIAPSDENLTQLARTYYGNGAYWWKIWLANLDVLPNPDRLERGASIVIPPAGPYTDAERRAIEAYQSGDLDAVQSIMASDPVPASEDPQPGSEDAQPEDGEAEGGAQAPADEADTNTSPEAEPESSVHRVSQGDVSLVGLARRYYDDASLWPKIWVANRGVLPIPEALEIGMELEIPQKAPLTAEERAALAAYNQDR